MTPPSPSYLHGTKPEEQRRLSLMNDLLNAASLRELGLRGGEKVIDFGCGLGQLTRAMARAVRPQGRVLGIEQSPEQIAEALRQARESGEEDLTEFRRGDVHEPPLSDDEWGSFDIAHARFLLEHVLDPLAVVRVMVRAVRPGGRIVLEDDDHELFRLWPEPAGFVSLWRAYERSFDRNGNDPYIGRRLVSLLQQAGAAPARNTVIFFGGCSGNPAFSSAVENMVGVLAGAREAILQVGSLDAGQFDEAISQLRNWERRPDAAMWYAIPWAEGARPNNPSDE